MLWCRLNQHAVAQRVTIRKPSSIGRSSEMLANRHTACPVLGRDFDASRWGGEYASSPDETSKPGKAGVVVGVSVVVAALVPIVPYLFLSIKTSIPVSVAAALLGLFVLGFGKGRLVQKSPWLQGLEIVGIGVNSKCHDAW